MTEQQEERVIECLVKVNDHLAHIRAMLFWVMCFVVLGTIMEVMT